MRHDSRSRILAAALEEFSEYGFGGARVERISKRSKANKQLIYYYFTDKRGLYQAVSKRVYSEIAAVKAVAPADFGDELVQWVDFHEKHPYLIRLLEWEGKRRASRGTGRDPQARIWLNSIRGMRGKRGKTAGRRAVSTEQLLIASIALVTWPLVFPTLCREVTGLSADSPKYLEDRREFVRAFGRAFRRT